jgi:hypothetical protein
MAGKFDLSSYETVKQRKKRFYDSYPDGRIVVEMVDASQITNYALFIAKIYKNRDDQQFGLILSTGHAFELRDKEKKLNKYGKEYESVNFSSWTENCEESAVGRALDNAGFASNMKCSREEIEKAQRMNQKAAEDNIYQEIITLISEYTEKFTNKTGLQLLLNELGVKSSKDIMSEGMDSKIGMLNKLKDFDLTKIDHPIPLEERTYGPDYVIQNAKHRGKKLKDIPVKELEEYLDTLQNRPTKKVWESELIEAIGTYLDMIE